MMSFLLPFLQLMAGAEEGSTQMKRIESSMWWTGTHLEPPGTGVEEPNWLYQGWGSGALLALAFNLVGSWLAGMLVKKMSSVMRLLAKAISLGVVYFIGECWLLKAEGRTPPLMC